MQPSEKLECERDRLEKARDTLATLVTEDAIFLPFFIRIENELMRLNSDCSALERARQLAQAQKATR